MPLDNSHQHSSADIMYSAEPHTPLPATAGGAPSSVYVSADDPGAIGANNLWLEVVFGDENGDGGDGRLWVRNSTDDGWNTGSPLSYSDATSTLVASPGDIGELSLNDSGGSAVSDPNSFKVQGGGKAIFINADGVHVGPGSSAPLLALVATPAEPKSEPGLAAAIGSLFINTSDGVPGRRQVWVKTDTLDTDWSYLVGLSSPVTIADIADPASATAEDVADKLNELMGLLRDIFVVG